MGYKFKPVSPETLAERLAPRPRKLSVSHSAKPGSYVSGVQGRAFVDEFLLCGEIAATVTCDTAVDTDHLFQGAKNHPATKDKVWLRRASPLEVLIVNLDLADDATITEYWRSRAQRR